MKRIFAAMILITVLISCTFAVSCDKKDTGGEGNQKSEPSLLERVFADASIDEIMEKYDSLLISGSTEDGAYTETLYVGTGFDGETVAEIKKKSDKKIVYTSTLVDGVVYEADAGRLGAVFVDKDSYGEYFDEEFYLSVPDAYYSYEYKIIEDVTTLKIITVAEGGFLSYLYKFDTESGFVTNLTKEYYGGQSNRCMNYTFTYGNVNNIPTEEALALHINSADATNVTLVEGENTRSVTLSRASSIAAYPDDYRVFTGESLVRDAEDLYFTELDEPTLYIAHKSVEIDFNVNLTTRHLSDYLAHLSELEAAVLADESEDTVLSLLITTEDEIYYITSQYRIAELVYYKDMMNSSAESRYTQALEIYFDAYEAFAEFAKTVYYSDSSYRDAIFADMTEAEIKDLISTDSETVRLEEEMKAIQDEHAQMDPTLGSWRGDVDELFVDYVGLANEFAEVKGYDNFYSYASTVVYQRDYSLSERQMLRENVKRYIVPGIKLAYKGFSEKASQFNQMYAETFISLLYDSPESFESDLIRLYTMNFDGELEDAFTSLIEKDALVVSTSSGAYPGAYTSYLAYYDEAYVYVGTADYLNLFTLVHELGHYASTHYFDIDSVPLDLAEVYSQGGEWLFLRYLKNYIVSGYAPEGAMLEDFYDAIAFYKLYETLAEVAICTIVDEFEERVYTHGNLTESELSGIMQELYVEYGLNSYEYSTILPLSVLQSYWRQVTLRSPVYYISYATSQMASIDIFIKAQYDMYDALEAYSTLFYLEEEQLSFTKALAKAGISSPFDDTVYAKLIIYLNNL